jgi:hypothetical protein
LVLIGSLISSVSLLLSAQERAETDLIQIEKVKLMIIGRVRRKRRASKKGFFEKTLPKNSNSDYAKGRTHPP